MKTFAMHAKLMDRSSDVNTFTNLDHGEAPIGRILDEG
jgi:hypothetical protein